MLKPGSQCLMACCVLTAQRYLTVTSQTERLIISKREKIRANSLANHANYQVSK